MSGWNSNRLDVRSNSGASLWFCSFTQFVSNYLIADWLKHVSLSLNIYKSAVLVFPAHLPNISPRFNLRSTTSIAIIFKQHTLERTQRFEHFAPLCSMIRSTLLLCKIYVRFILKFGSTMFSGLPNYRLSRLFVLEHRVLVLCLGLMMGVANNMFYTEARIPTLQSRFRYLAMSTSPRLTDCPSLRSNTLVLRNGCDFLRFQLMKYNVS